MLLFSQLSYRRIKKKSYNSKNITSSYSEMYHVISELEIIITPADVMKWKDENKETLRYL